MGKVRKSTKRSKDNIYALGDMFGRLVSIRGLMQNAITQDTRGGIALHKAIDAILGQALHQLDEVYEAYKRNPDKKVYS